MKIKSINVIKVAAQEDINNVEISDKPETSNLIQEFVKKLSLKLGASSLVKKPNNEGNSYEIYFLGEGVSLSKDIIGFIASAPFTVYLSEMNGQLALFIFKG